MFTTILDLFLVHIYFFPLPFALLRLFFSFLLLLITYLFRTRRTECFTSIIKKLYDHVLFFFLLLLSFHIIIFIVMLLRFFFLPSTRLCVQKRKEKNEAKVRERFVAHFFFISFPLYLFVHS